MRELLPIGTVIAALLGACSPAANPCLPLPAPHVVVEEPGRLLQYWLVEDRPSLNEAALPESQSLHEFRERIAAALDVDPRALLERQLPHVTGGDAENVRLVLSGEAGSLRPMSCLEGLLLATQTERSVAQGRSMETHPTEFLSYILKRGNTLKIWYYTVDQAGVGGLATLHEPLDRDLVEGWTVAKNLHNHNFFLQAADGKVLGGMVPSATDIEYLRNMGIERATITNGFDSIDLAPADLERFVGHSPK